MQQPNGKPRDLWTDEEFIKAFGPDAQKRGYPVSLGKLRRPTWTGRIPTYLVWCERCRIRPNGGFTVAHEAGREKRLECSYCRTRYDHLLPSRRAKDMLLNPHHHPWLIAFLLLMAMLTAYALN